MKDNCIFCRIVNKEIEADVVYEDGEIVAFKDINPQAPVHFVFIPRRHIETLNDISPEDAALLGKLLARIRDAARENGIAEDGYRVVINCNRDAGQEVFHLHLHLLGGRNFSWPPG